jgi:hypothetical protein
MNRFAVGPPTSVIVPLKSALSESSLASLKMEAGLRDWIILP